MKGKAQISLFCIGFVLCTFISSAQNTVNSDINLPELLDAAADYCRRLEGAALDFVCLEKIAEIFDPRLDVKPPVVYPLEKLMTMTDLDRLKALSNCRSRSETRCSFFKSPL